MIHKNIRKGITTAKLNEDNSNILFGEIALISIFIGLGSKSWWWGGGIFLALIIALNIRPVAIILMLILSVCWGMIGYGIGTLFDTTGAMVVLALFGFIIGLGVHLSALEWTEDIVS